MIVILNLTLSNQSMPTAYIDLSAFNNYTTKYPTIYGKRDSDLYKVDDN